MIALKQMSTENPTKTTEVKYPSKEQMIESDTQKNEYKPDNNQTDIEKEDRTNPKEENASMGNATNQSSNNSQNKTTSSTVEQNNNSQQSNGGTSSSINTSQSTNTSANYTNKDKAVISTFSNIESDVNTLLKSGNDQSILDKAKGVFISIVDFIFYDGTIGGVTFNELTDAGKQQVLSIAHAIDSKIESHFPGYKETISSKTKDAFNKASEVIKNGASNIKNFAREKLGEEYYQEIINAKDEFVLYTKNALSVIGDIGSNLLNKGKDFLNNWYQNFKKGTN